MDSLGRSSSSQPPPGGDRHRPIRSPVPKAEASGLCGLFPVRGPCGRLSFYFSDVPAQGADGRRLEAQRHCPHGEYSGSGSRGENPVVSLPRPT